MCRKDAPRQAAGLEQRKAEQDRVAHTRPDGLGYILVERNVLHQHGVDCHADDDEKRLEREGKEASEVVLAHAAPLAAHHRRHGYWGYGGGEVDFQHPAVDDDEDADSHGPRRYTNEQRRNRAGCIAAKVSNLLLYSLSNRRFLCSVLLRRFQ